MVDEVINPEEVISGETKLQGQAALDAIAEELDINAGFIVKEETDPHGITRNIIVGNAVEVDEEVSARKDPNDRRTRVKNSKEYPYCAYGLVFAAFRKSPKEKWTCVIGTGTAIDSRHILTARHIVYCHSLGGYAKGIAFHPARNGKTPPYGMFAAKHRQASPNWIEGRYADWNMGMIILKEALPAAVKCVDTKVLEDEELQKLNVTVIGYPGDKPGGDQLWQDTGPVVDVNPENITYKASTGIGDSGGGVINDVAIKETKYQFATHIAIKGAYPKTGCRLTKSKKATLDEWLKKYK